MGHSITYQVFGENATKGTMLAARARYIEDNGDRDGGRLLSSDNGFTLHDIVCDSYEAAVEKIAEYDNGWYDDHGVKYYDYSGIKPTKQMENLKEKIKELREKKSEYIKVSDIHNRKSDSISCPKCGSRLALAYLHGNSCPLCRTELRSNTTLQRIKSFDEKIRECESKYAECEKKLKKKAKINWLVKLEFHV